MLSDMHLYTRSKAVLKSIYMSIKIRYYEFQNIEIILTRKSV